jgi:hypothetical protein
VPPPSGGDPGKPPVIQDQQHPTEVPGKPGSSATPLPPETGTGAPRDGGVPFETLAGGLLIASGALLSLGLRRAAR